MLKVCNALQTTNMFWFFPGYPDGFYDVADYAAENIHDDLGEYETFFSSDESAWIKSPNVLREVRDFFDCATLNGAELEDDGGSGSAFKHWETRIFQVRMFLSWCSFLVEWSGVKFEH
jgi:Leishmanolysin